MKRRYLSLLAILAILTLTSCHKSGVRLFEGDYSFKTSGEISISVEGQIDSTDINIPATLDISLANEVGQLNICSSEKKNDNVVVVLNYLNGDVVVTSGTCNGNTIELSTFQRNVLPVSVSSLLSNFSILVSGNGQMYDDMIIFDMTYKGKASIGTVSYKIKGKDVKMVAYRN